MSRFCYGFGTITARTISPDACNNAWKPRRPSDSQLFQATFHPDTKSPDQESDGDKEGDDRCYAPTVGGVSQKERRPKRNAKAKDAGSDEVPPVVAHDS